MKTTGWLKATGRTKPYPEGKELLDVACYSKGIGGDGSVTLLLTKLDDQDNLWHLFVSGLTPEKARILAKGLNNVADYVEGK